MASLGYTGDPVIFIDRPVYFEKLDEVFTEENVPLIRDWFVVKTAAEMADLLDKETSRGAARLNGRLSGVEIDAKEENADGRKTGNQRADIACGDISAALYTTRR